MKVGLFFPGFDQFSGGGFTFEQEIIQALSRLDLTGRHEFVLFFSGAEKQTLPEFTNLTSVWIEMPKPPSRMRRYASRFFSALGIKSLAMSSDSVLQKTAKEHAIQMMWFPTPIFLPVEMPYIATVWDIQHRNQPWFPEVSQNGIWDFRESTLKPFLQRAAYILTPNQAGQDELSLYYQLPASRFRKLPHPVPVVQGLPSEEEIHQVKEKYNLKRPYLFYPAQFWPHKNHASLVKTLEILRDQHHIDMDLVLCGSDHGNLKFIQGLVERAGLQEQVHYLSFIPREELMALYCGAFALTYVTFFGPENLPPLEAMACGCPVIASDVPGALEQYGNAAMLVDPRKPEEMASAVKEMKDKSKLRVDMITHGKKRAGGFNSLDYVNGVIELLDEFEPVRSNWE